MNKPLVFLLGCALVQAETIVSVGGPLDFGGSIGSNQAQTAGFTTGQAYSDVKIAALINGLLGQTVNAYLTTTIGPGTTVVDEVAFAIVNFPGGIGGVMTTIFSGLSLATGQYYLTLFNPASTSGTWYSTESPAITTSPGSSHDFSGYFITNDNPLPYPPAASYVDLSTNDGRTLIYQVETSPIPEPGTYGLIAAAGLCFFLKWIRGSHTIL